MAGVEQNRYKTSNGCIKHLPQTGSKASFRMPGRAVTRVLTGGGAYSFITVLVDEFLLKPVVIGDD